MAEMAMMAATVASVVLKGMQTSSQNEAIAEQQDARTETTRQRVEELHRQQGRADEIAQEERSDIAQRLAIEIGTLRAASADSGITTAALARVGGAVGAVAGLDKARVNSNLFEGQRQRRAESIALMSENDAAAKQSKSNITNNTLGFYASAAGSIIKADFDFNSTPDPNPVRTKYSGPQRGEGRYPASGAVNY